jgi:hypothetical protein
MSVARKVSVSRTPFLSGLTPKRQAQLAEALRLLADGSAPLRGLRRARQRAILAAEERRNANALALAEHRRATAAARARVAAEKRRRQKEGARAASERERERATQEAAEIRAREAEEAARRTEDARRREAGLVSAARARLAELRRATKQRRSRARSNLQAKVMLRGCTRLPEGQVAFVRAARQRPGPSTSSKTGAGSVGLMGVSPGDVLMITLFLPETLATLTFSLVLQGNVPTSRRILETVVARRVAEICTPAATEVIARQ